MPNGQNLSLVNVINVTVVAPAASLQPPNMSALAIITQATKPAGWGADQTYAVYVDPDSVADDWGTDSDMHNMAIAIFSQVPNILTGNGYLVIIPRLTSPSLETVEECLDRMANSVFFEGILLDSEYGSDTSTFLNLSDYVQASQWIMFYCTSDIAALQPGSYVDQVRTRGNFRTRCLYSGNDFDNDQTQIFSAAYASRAMSVNFSGARTMLSMNLQTLATIDPDQTIDQTSLELAADAGVDVYVSISGIPCVITSGGNLFFDQVYGRTWLAFQLATNGFNFLKTAASIPGKIPQTEEGMTGLKNAYIQAFLQGVTCGYLAPGTWTAPISFGNPEDFTSSILTQGYYIVSQPISAQAQSERDERTAPLVQAAVKEAGAVHKSNVIVYVNA